jgi:peptide chain release factor 3
LRIGDTLSESEDFNFLGIPTFAPEVLRRVRLDDPMKAKQLKKALEDLAEEGVSQVFKPLDGSTWIVGVVGPLQFDVLTTRIESEYNIKAGFEDGGFVTARWVAAESEAELKRFMDSNKSNMAEDRDGGMVYLARNTWQLNRAQQDFEKVRFTATREQH